MMDKFSEFFMMQNQAKNFEKSGMNDKALELYLKIINDYLPNNDFSFDRAATLLEKKGKYVDAIGVCEKALERIKAADIPGDADKYRQKIERMQEKVKSESDFHVSVNKKEPEVFHFGLPGFRGHNKLLMLVGTGYYGLAAFSAYPDQLFTFLFLFCLAFVGSYGLETMMKLANSKACTKAMSVTLITLIISGYSMAQLPQIKAYWNVDGTQTSEEDGERTGDDGEPEPGAADKTDPPDTDRMPPEIPDKYLTAAAKAAEKNPAADFADVSVDSGTVIMSLIVKPGTSSVTIEKIADEMARTLSGLMTSEGLKGPKDDSYGELYSFYGLALEVADTLEQPVLSGSLMKNSNIIKWSKP